MSPPTASADSSADPAAVRDELGARHGKPVQIVETHVSWVFLVGERAYKLKKPLKLTFLDYSTPALRRLMCQRELELNRRLAPQIYLGITSVVQDGAELRLARVDEPGAIDYLVEMQRFDEDETLAARLAAGTVTLGELEAVGALLADFHDSAEAVTPSGGPVVAVWDEFEQNIAQLIECAEPEDVRRRVLRLAQSVHGLLEDRREHLRARLRQGRIRDCHGDLRADHVILRRPPAVIDCVEFEPALRAIDVGDDLSFLIMDLVARDHHEAARTLMRAYRAAGGDPGDDGLVALYAVHRALVRVKVALIRAAEVTNSEPTDSTHLARHLTQVAEGFVWRARMPLAIVICGVPGSGKSYLADALARRTLLPTVSSDELRNCAIQVDPDQSSAFSAEANHATYSLLGNHARTRARQAGGAIIDGTFRHRSDREAFFAAFGAAAPIVFVECRAPLAVLEHRAIVREAEGTSMSKADLSVVRREHTAWDSLDEIAAADHLIVRTDRAVDATLDAINAALDARLLAEHGRAERQ